LTKDIKNNIISMESEIAEKNLLKEANYKNIEDMKEKNE
jgi:hypothetical protein